MQTDRPIKLFVETYERLRSLHYFVQFQTLNAVGRLIPFVELGKTKYSATLLKLLINEINELIEFDAKNIADGVYPISVLKPEPLLTHLQRVPKLLLDGVRLGLRRRLNRTKDFALENDEEFSHLPEYFRRNFHFQTDGYLTKKSAELYDHQVDLLFSGTADAMRRLFLAALKRELATAGTPAAFKALEVGVGTGAATRNMRATFGAAEIHGVDLSEPYLERARERLNTADGSASISLKFGDATQLDFADSSFDVVYSVFMFHELPEEIRSLALKEFFRVLKPGGFFAYVDSLQLGRNSNFDHVLECFPIDFHEPFYTNYIKTPMADLILRAASNGGGIAREAEAGHKFLSQFGVYQKLS